MNTTKKEVKKSQKADVFICHSIHLQKKTISSDEGKPFTTPRFKKPEDSRTFNAKQGLQPKNFGGSLILHRPYGLDA